MRWWVLVIGMILTMPFASAAPVSGILDVSGAIGFPPHALATSAPLVLFVPNAASGRIAGDAVTASVQVFEYRFASANALVAKPSVALPASGHPAWQAHEVIFDVQPGRSGWVGIRVDGASLSESSSIATRLWSESDAQVGNGVSGSDTRKDAGFLVPLEGPSLLRRADAWSLTGGASLKIYGPTVTITSRENVTILETGEWSDADAPGQIVRRWVILDVEQATVQGEDILTEVASREARVVLDGTATFEKATGMLHASFEEWRTDGGDARIDGSFALTATTSSEPGTITLSLTGDLRGSSLSSRLALPPAPGAARGMGVIVAVGLLMTIGTAYYVHKKAQKPPAPEDRRLDAESLAVLAERAADAGDYERAAALLGHARRSVPTSRRIALDHAFFVSQAGDSKRALRLLEDPLIRNDPDALILATRLHAQCGEYAEADTSLVRALEAAPSLVLEIEDDPAYQPLLDHDRVKAAVRRARRRLK